MNFFFFETGINWQVPSKSDENKYVAVFWPDDGRWYAAMIDRANDGSARDSTTRTEDNGMSTHHLKYLDGTEGQGTELIGHTAESPMQSSFTILRHSDLSIHPPHS